MEQVKQTEPAPASAPEPRRAAWKGLAWLKSRELWVFTPLYFFLGWIELTLKLWLTGGFLDGTLLDNHLRLIAFKFFNNEQSRLLQYMIPEFLSKTFHFSVEYAYMLQRWIFIFLAFLAFHFYLRKWFSSGASLAGVACLAALLPFTFATDLQESSPLLTLTFVLALWAIRDHQDLLYMLVLWVGSLNNETMLILPAVYFFYNVQIPRSWRIKKAEWLSALKLAGMTVLLAIPGFASQGIMRYITRDRPHLGGDLVNWQYNWNGIWNGLHMKPWLWQNNHFLFFILIFLVFWIYAILSYRKCGLFLQRALWMVPLFILAHLITGKIEEVRQMVPLAYIAIPMGMFFLLPDEVKAEKASPLASQ